MAYRETEQVRRRKAETRQELLRAGEKLVRSGGFDALQMQAVASSAGVGVGTVYRYFTGREELAGEVFRRATEREIAALDEALAVAGSALNRLEHGLAVFARRALSAPRLARALIAQPVSPGLEASRLHYRREYARRFQHLLDEALAAGLVPEQSTEVSANALVGAIAEALAGPLADDAAGAERIEAVCRFCLRAVGAVDTASRPAPESLPEISHEG